MREGQTVTWWIVTGLLIGIIGFGILADERTDAERLAHLGDRIACPVCDGNSMAASPAQFAQDMMAITEERIAAGESDEEIIAYFETRFGPEIVLGRGPGTQLLWVAPLVVLAGGVWLAAGRRRGAAATTNPIEVDPS